MENKFSFKEGTHPLVSILGDSISTLDGYNPPEFAVYYEGEMKFVNNVFQPADTWWGQVIEALDGELLVNNSYSGSRMSLDPGCILNNHGCSEHRTAMLGKEGKTPDLVMIFMGVNDLGSRKMHLLPEVEGDAGNIQVFSVAYETALQRIKKNYPKAEILCITPGRAYLADYGPSLPPADVRRRAMCAIIKALAEQYGCLFFDLSDGEPYESYDGLHPNANGMETIARQVLTALL